MFRCKLNMKCCTADSLALVSLPLEKINNPSQLSLEMAAKTNMIFGWTNVTCRLFNDLFSTSFFCSEEKVVYLKLICETRKKQNDENGFLNGVLHWRSPHSYSSHDSPTWRTICVSHSALRKWSALFMRRETSHMICPLGAYIALRNSSPVVLFLLTCNHILPLINWYKCMFKMCNRITTNPHL